MKKVLVIEDDASIRSNLEDLLREEDFEVVSAADGKRGIDLAQKHKPDVVVCDILLPEIDGYGVLGALRADASTTATPFLFLTAKAEKSDVRLGMNLGADDYITKPFSNADLVAAIRARIERAEEVASHRRPEPLKLAPPKAPVVPPGMRALYQQIDLVAREAISVLVLGENGVGKEVVARALHARSPRADKPFVALNAAALPESLLESELFGHVKGAHSTATADRPGLFETANGGTFFLDELGDLPLALQAKLLRVLQEREVMRLGGRAPIKLDVRLVTATNRDLEDAIARGAFREDLYYRIAGFTIAIPPLRERPSDILPLADELLTAACAASRRSVPELAADAKQRLVEHPWPGNVRELKNAVERALVLCGSGPIHAAHFALRAPVRAKASDAPRDAIADRRDDSVKSGARTLAEEQAELEKKRILEALERCGGNQTKAAEVLGISRRTLVTRLGEYNVPRPRKPSSSAD